MIVWSLTGIKCQKDGSNCNSIVFHICDQENKVILLASYNFLDYTIRNFATKTSQLIHYLYQNFRYWKVIFCCSFCDLHAEMFRWVGLWRIIYFQLFSSFIFHWFNESNFSSDAWTDHRGCKQEKLISLWLCLSLTLVLNHVINSINL